MALTFKQITGSTDTVHIFNDVFSLTPRVVAPPFTDFHNQLRVFKKNVANVVTELFPVGRPSSTGTTDFTIDTAGTQITLDTALVATDTLVIMRETQINRPFVVLTNVGRFHGRDRNVRGDQILFLVQELRELRAVADILGSGTGEPFEYGPKVLDKTLWTQTDVGDGVKTNFSYSNIEMFPLTAVEHDGQLIVLLDDVLQMSGFTVNESTITVDFTVAPSTGVSVTIQRVTRIDKRWVTFEDGSTFSSLQDIWDFLNIKFIIEETIGFPEFLLPNALSNRIFARALNILNFSGSGDRFFFGNLAWFGDGTVYIFKNDLLIVDGVDYTIDFIFFTISLSSALVAADKLKIVTTTPNHAFNRLGFSFPGGKKDLAPDPTVPPSEPIFPEIDLSPAIDTHITKVSPDTNFESNIALAIDGEDTAGERLSACLEFDLSSVIPENSATIKLRFRCRTGSGGNDTRWLLRRVIQLWDLDETTWNDYKDVTAWGLAGGQQSGVDYDPTPVVLWTLGILNAGDIVVSTDIKAMVVEAKAAGNVLRLMVAAQPIVDQVGINVDSLDSVTPAHRPLLQFRN